jgi:hypothetical protein
MAKYDNIDVNGKDAFANKTPSYDSIMKQKAKDTKKALHKQKKEDDMEAAGKAMDEEIAKEAEEKAAVEKQALENNGSTVETRDKNKALETGDETVTAVEDIKTQAAKPETENAEEFQIDTKANVLPENVAKELDESDEGKEANSAVEANNPTALQNIVTPDGDPVLKGTYNEDGVYLPHTYTIEDSRLVKNPGMAACLTIVSKAITALGAIAGIPIPMIDFMKFGATPEEDLQKLNENEQNYAKILNAGKAEANETIRTREATQESNLSDIDAYKNLADEDVQKTAQVNAATAGQNAQLDVQKAAQEWEAKQKELDRNFQKEMNNLNTDSQIEILKQQGVNQQDLATLMNDLDAQRIMKKIAYAKEAGLTPDETAKWLRAEQGITQFGAAMGYMGDATKVAGQVAGALMTGGISDKGVKKFVYDGKAANSKMFSSKRKFW